MKNLIGITLILIITILGIGFSTYYTTVFYGVPVWKEAQPTLFCASDADITSRDKHNIWATHNCVPLDPNPYEVTLANVSIRFNMEENYMVQEMKEDILSLFQQSFKPCVKLTPFCIKMTCTMTNTTNKTLNSATTTLTPTVNLSSIPNYEVYNCSFNQTTEFRDKKKQIYSLFYREDIVKEDGNNNSYYLHNCNTSVITQECDKSTFEPIPIRYCAPAGFALLKCRDQNFTGKGQCSNVSVVHCTHGIYPMIATALHLNGSLEEEETKAYFVNTSVNTPLLVKFNVSINLTCERTGNNTRGQVQIGPGMTFYNIENVVGDTRKAYCSVNATTWYRNLDWAMAAINTTMRARNETVQQTFQWQRDGDPEVTSFWFNCQGEFFYCNLTNWTNTWTANRTNNTHGTLVAPCRLRQIVNHWGIVSKGVYLPPRRGTVKCHSNITGLIMTAEKDNNNSYTPQFSAVVEDYWKVELARYKVVEIQPLSVAPRPGKRPEIKANHTRSRRDVGIGLLFLGFLSAAGSTMGAASIALTAQARGLLSGIVQQQQNLLQAIEAQQHLLQLSVWGIKQLQARMLAVEKYIRDQQLLSLWGCANKLVCHSSVPWNLTWAEDSTKCNHSDAKYYDCIWNNLTWQEWDRLVENSTGTIYSLLEKAQTQQEKNKQELLELDKWSSLWDWFDITQWLWYIKIAIIIVAGLVGLRILMFIVNVVKQVRQGYTPLFSQIPTQAEQDPEQPGGIAGGGGGRDNIRWTPSPAGFFSIVWEDLRNLLIWIYQTFQNFIWILWISLQALKQGIISLAHSLVIVHRTIIVGVRQIIEWSSNTYASLRVLLIQAIDRLANFTGWWTDLIIEGVVYIARGIRNIPRRIRQGLELALN
ncbi:env [Simian immunodeficiency virus]|uniref:Envelope glycoprotein gp160 n=2 Tax=Simian immunodeficiency virus TaxID=11723 RepID=ENV_SIVTN|nr:RecName: Full=Envelope glycoprotein gp160; AltName: Full=Env polyprotein; Contains: RecName: Full=Surface protein gp120; Short=SU; AltName: Full=Glycoprotein 120; Short=gp120; Contains: RecName: Full=Transmembrane protein gp41; Short=TM; AltName: Full=Glycoprotein 32; Short=gp32; Flags: Precursor [SIVcpz TAN1]AAO13966.1 env [Simian immunodeficiency virus]ABQ51066.1 envelope glycoprotein [Simian immunodeficiency virus]